MRLSVEHALRQDLGSTDRDCISEIASYTRVSIFLFLHLRVIQLQLPQIGILSSNTDSSIKGGSLRASPFPHKARWHSEERKKATHKEKKCEYCSEKYQPVSGKHCVFLVAVHQTPTPSMCVFMPQQIYLNYF